VERPGVSFYTLGCKLNQLETESIADAFGKAGFNIVPWESRSRRDILVFNTCTVTSKAEQKARRVIRCALRESAAAVIVTGCYAQLGAEKIAALEGEVLRPAGVPGRLFVIPGGAKDSILDLPFFLAGLSPGEGEHGRGDSGGLCLAGGIRRWFETWRTDAGPAGEPGSPPAVGPVPAAGPALSGAFRFTADEFSFHSRAFLKIQDGCDRRCAYCRVPLARGKSQSLDSTEVLARLAALESRKQAEAVLTGVNIAQYRCPATGRNLGELLCFLLKHTSSIALRLSSIEVEPGFFNPAFLDAVSSSRVRPHFHLSVQSGSAAVLDAMGRPYSPRDIRESAALLRNVKGDPFLGCDIITGFPGESPEDFEKTRGLCGDIGFAWIHGFPYSPRPGTTAYVLGNRVSEAESGKRLKTLMEISRNGRKAYVRRWIGKTVDAVAETKKFPFLNVLTDNYLRLCIPEGTVNPSGRGNLRSGGFREETAAPVPGSALKCRITPLDQQYGGFDASGEIGT
jgi:threonylcarbamoyladenosine tRNA methylthiotransferase MtaB